MCDAQSTRSRTENAIAAVVGASRPRVGTQQREHAGPYRAPPSPEIATVAVPIDVGMMAEVAEAAIAPSRTIDEATILDIHRALMGSDDEQAGSLRTEQVWIGGSNVGPHRADYVAPHHDRVPLEVDDLVRFVARTDVPGLVHVALTHAQFETVHPLHRRERAHGSRTCAPRCWPMRG